MYIWIRNEIGQLEGYSMSEVEGFIKIEVKEEPKNFALWGFNGNEVYYNPSGFKPNLEEPEQSESERIMQLLSDLEIKYMEKEALLEQLGQQMTDLEIKLLESQGE